MFYRLMRGVGGGVGVAHQVLGRVGDDVPLWTDKLVLAVHDVPQHHQLLPVPERGEPCQSVEMTTDREGETYEGQRIGHHHISHWITQLPNIHECIYIQWG